MRAGAIHRPNFPLLATVPVLSHGLPRFIQVRARHRRWLPGAGACTLTCMGSPESKPSRVTLYTNVVLDPYLSCPVRPGKAGTRSPLLSHARDSSAPGLLPLPHRKTPGRCGPGTSCGIRDVAQRYMASAATKTA